MSILSLTNVIKRYHNHTAVNGVSFEVPESQLFGLLGPNGAGKTSLIRIITSITGADEGTILVEGQPLSPDHILKIGYMPEERGLYKKMKVGEQLLYLAQLKGLSRKEAVSKIKYWLEKFEIHDWLNKKIEELSKGMQQKIQFIATVMHEPKLIILDEPFSGLDPINTNLIKDEIQRLKNEGASIIFSTHRMEQVEEICEHIVLMNNGKVILNGRMNEVKESFKEHKYRIVFRNDTPLIESNQLFTVLEKEAQSFVIKINDNVEPNQALNNILSHGSELISYSEILPSLNEIFIKQVESH